MVTQKTVARCQACGAHCARWVGRCPECGEWGTVVEENVGRRAEGPAPDVELTPLASQELGAADRMATGIEEVDRVLGGGLVRGSVVLLAGEPGVGKSTLTLQMAVTLAASGEVLLVCGEESPEQVRARAERLGPVPSSILTLDDPSLPRVLAAAERGTGPIVVDSVQTLFDPDVPSAPGSVAQVRECGARLARLARERGRTVVLVGHVTKDGSVAGPRVLEHLVDTVLTFDGDRQGGLRVLRALKNRFGSTQEVGFFEMTGEGLLPIRDASRYLLADRCPGLAGSVLAGCVEGRRPFVCEMQALVGLSELAVPRRVALGIESARLPVLVAVLERRLRTPLVGKEVFVSAVGGMRVTEPAADLPVALAILSAWRGTPLPDDLVAFGEIGLAGEIRQVAATERRLAEAAGVGCRRAAVPGNYAGDDFGLRLVRLAHLRDALAFIEASAPVGATVTPIKPPRGAG